MRSRGCPWPCAPARRATDHAVRGIQKSTRWKRANGTLQEPGDQGDGGGEAEARRLGLGGSWPVSRTLGCEESRVVTQRLVLGWPGRVCSNLLLAAPRCLCVAACAGAKMDGGRRARNATGFSSIVYLDAAGNCVRVCESEWFVFG